MRGRALLLTGVAFFSLVVIPAVSPLAAQELQLPSGDLTAPHVEHEPATGPVSADTPVTITATVTDDTGVKAVTLYYRRAGESPYSRLAMEREGDTDVYRASIPKEAARAPGVEYYIQAVDLAGNSLLRGYSFSPLMVTVQPGAVTPPSSAEYAQPLPETPKETEAKAKEGKKSHKTLLYTLLGVAVVGVIAGVAAGGGGGGGGGGGSDTGTVTVSAPTP